MGKLNRHWTSGSTDHFLYRIGSDFIQQIEDVKGPDTSQAALAQALGVSEGRVSQVFNNPGNLTLRKVIEYARAVKRKVAIVLYDDDDPENENGPINSEIFRRCWNQAGKPKDFYALADSAGFAANAGIAIKRAGYLELKPVAGNTSFRTQDSETIGRLANNRSDEVRTYGGAGENYLQV